MSEPDLQTESGHFPPPPAAKGTDVLTLAHAEPGKAYHVVCLGETRHARMELLAAGLAPDTVINLLRGNGSRPRIVACGDIRAAIGADLALAVHLSPCGCGCGCDSNGEQQQEHEQDFPGRDV
ncbi:FeoA domain-containing protein [Roseibium aggregatum]|uniref:FeoA domain-containing protein n=1 Tax=Roseibium aggregatum TaxID=187304 RepID=UPI003A976FA0